MRVLIVQSNSALALIWARHLQRLGAEVEAVETAEAALKTLQLRVCDVIVLDLMLRDGSALTVAEFADFNMPRTNVVFVTDTTFFSDGSIFAHSANARAFIETRTPPKDLAEIVHHYGGPPVPSLAATPEKVRTKSRQT